MSMGLSQDRGVALRQFLLYHSAVVQNVLRASGLIYVRAHDPMVTMEALVETDDEFDVDAPSVSRPTRGEPLEPQRPAAPPAAGREVVETGVGADLAPGVDAEIQTEAFTPTPRRQLFVSPTVEASPSAEDVSPEEAPSSRRPTPLVPPIPGFAEAVGSRAAASADRGAAGGISVAAEIQRSPIGGFIVVRRHGHYS